MAGYIRQDVTNNIATGNVINASDFDNEYNAIEAAFHASTGHTHDGTAAEGAPITKIGPTQDVVASASALTPKTDNTVDLGSSILEYKDLWIDGTANIDSLVADTADINAGTIDGVTIGGASAGAGTFTSLTTSSTVTLNAGTANGVLYLNGSKVATSGSGFTYNGSTLLDVTGSVRASGTLTASYSPSYDQTYISQNGAPGSGCVMATVNYANSAYQPITYDASYYAWRPSGTEGMRLNSTGLGIGTSSPAGKLHVVGDSLSNTFKLIANTTVSGSDATIFRPADNTMAFSTNGAERARIDASGNLGIGTSSPVSKLHVAGDIQQDNANYLKGKLAAGTTTRLFGLNASNALYIGSIDADHTGGTLFVKNGATQMMLDSSGNLGLGVTPSGNYTLQTQINYASGFKGASIGGASIGSSSSGYPGVGYNVRFTNTGDAYNYNGTDTASLVTFKSGGFQFLTAASGTAGNAISFTQAMTLSGTSAPALRVGVTADLGGFNFQAANQVGFSVHNSGSSATAAYFSAANNVTLTSAGNFAVINGIDGILFGAAATERARITSGGDLLVGTTSSLGEASKLAVDGGTAQAAIFKTNGDNRAVQIYNEQNGNFTAIRFLVNNFGTAVGSITCSTTATAYNTSSDYRLKDNPQPLTGSGAFIDSLKPKTWQWKVDGSRGVGFLAHEAQEVSPSSVAGAKDAVDADGKPVMQAMEYGSAEFIANIVAEIQSLRARVAALEAA